MKTLKKVSRLNISLPQACDICPGIPLIHEFCDLLNKRQQRSLIKQLGKYGFDRLSQVKARADFLESFLTEDDDTCFVILCALERLCEMVDEIMESVGGAEKVEKAKQAVKAKEWVESR